ncbi:MAG: PD40 domain-containing protein [Acidobacteria bacterium]|nr:PD40 domain-containing protein [Acidobacteriota bacterium]
MSRAGAVALAAVVVAIAGCGEPRGAEMPVAAAAVEHEPPDAGPAAAASGATAAPAEPLPALAQPYRAVTTGTLAFQSDVSGRPKIYTLDLANGRVTALTRGRDWRDESPRWSPDGRVIAFASNRAHYGPDAESGTPDFDVYVMRADGSDIRRVTRDPGNDVDPSWMPDGQSLIFSSDRESRGDLYRVWLADGRTERLTHNFVGRALMPAVSPDGRQVAFGGQTLRIGQFWSYQVHVLDLASGESRPLPSSGGACWPSWSPDGRTLFNVQLDSEPSSIQRRDLASGAVGTAHAHATQWSYYPRVSPDGQWLVIATSPEHHAGEDWDLALVSTSDPNRRVTLTTGPGNDRLADWKPAS